MSVRLSARQIWGMPVMLGILSVIGLVSGLLGDGGWDVLSWVALSLPIVVIVWYIRRPHP